MFYSKASTGGAFYLFEDVDVALSQSGTFEIAFFNASEKNFAELSGMTLFVGEITEPDGGGGEGFVPIPAAAWLFGSALLGFVGYARRRRGSDA